MKPLIVFMPLFIISCSTLLPQKTPKEGKTVYSYTDASGRYQFTREHKLIKNKIVTRTQISSNQGSSLKPLEKSIMVAQLGSIKEKKKRILISRPYASEFTIWLEGKKYDSKMRLDTKSKTLKIELKSPEEKWKGLTSVPFPKGAQFCFFSQIPDCLYHNLYLTQAKDKKGEPFHFYIVWDSYPYLQEYLTGVGERPFAPAVLKFEGEKKSILRFVIDVNGQTILYQFSKSFDLVRMFWIAQGITILPPGEEISDVDG